MTNKRIIRVHSGPYRCLAEGCRRPAVYGENFSLKARGEGWCLIHMEERRRAA